MLNEFLAKNKKLGEPLIILRYVNSPFKFIMLTVDKEFSILKFKLKKEKNNEITPYYFVVNYNKKNISNLIDHFVQLYKKKKCDIVLDKFNFKDLYC